MIGYLDDVILVPLGILLAVRLVPKEVMAELSSEAERRVTRSTTRTGAIAIIAIWFVGATVFEWWVFGPLARI